MRRPTVRTVRGLRAGAASSGSGRRRVATSVGCLLSALVIALLPLPKGTQEAQAATAPESAVTKSGAKGTYDDFSGLKVTVHQTEGLRGQGVRVTWTGGEPARLKGQNFLQIMQCWGDDPQAGPDREQCEWGADSKAQPGSLRDIATPSLRDPLETEYAPDSSGYAFAPFRPVEGPETTASRDYTYFSPEDTNALPWLPHDGDGGGEVVFEAKSALESPHLGCGARTTSVGEARPCWLVVVPRGEHEPDGGTGNSGALNSSALSQSNWNQRIVFRLGFEPVTDDCDTDKPERGIEGSELATDAVTSWQAALCRTGSHRFTYTQSSELHGREVARTPSDTTGLGLTVNPVEAAEGSAEVVHAPVAVNGLTIGFVWMYDRAGIGETANMAPMGELKLNQRLLAKVLTQSYALSLVSPSDRTPAYLGDNPRTIGQDPEFQKLNAGLPALDSLKSEYQSPLGLAVALDNSDSAQLIWRYILADRDAREFIEGKEDPWGMKINPEYEPGMISESLDYYPKADLTPTTVTCNDATYSMERTGQDVVPYVADMHEAAVKVRRGDIGTAYECAVSYPSATTKLTPLGRPVLTDQRAFGIVDNVSAARYQLSTAALPNADGEYVEPTDASLLEAVAQMHDSDVAGVKAADPGRMKGGAYPLATVVYAAASLGQAEDARQDYAKVIRYAAGEGQTQGTAKGQLPYGYAPLPDPLREQARQAADRLEKGAPDSSGSPGPDAPGQNDDLSGTSGGTTGGLTGGTDGGGVAGGTGTAGTAGDATGPAAGPAGSAPSDPSGTDPARQNVAQSGGLTPGEVLGLVRWVLLGVLIAGGVAGLAGPIMLRLSARRAVSGG
ncbi:hypothetical protein [Streptomyces poonensis]|uniref:Uncharacterized protein n=1 Tax=Streptomyces poonensis TaxID=68255 RepID=A0A918UCE9_9ACTN|nr:hypothetical protein [Streptomyces poonensis]GGY91569.1 hypothetical protein GCM10010365_07500 [Streptomyces poonensis]GLJ87812.1 hypothetical protein GCM10017589_04120 [Streptomyces poonensis]